MAVNVCLFADSDGLTDINIDQGQPGLRSKLKEYNTQVRQTAPAINTRYSSTRHMEEYQYPDSAAETYDRIRALLELPTTLIDLIFQQQRRLPRSHHLYHRGDAADELYVVLDGSLKAYWFTEDGDEDVVGFYFMADLLGTDGFLSNEHTMSVVVLEDALVCPVSITTLRQLMTEDENLRYHWWQLMSRMIREEHNVTGMLRQSNAEERVISFLFHLRDHQRMIGKCTGETEFCHVHLPMTRRDIANYLGLSMETVSRALTRLKQRGLVYTMGHDVDVTNSR